MNLVAKIAKIIYEDGESILNDDGVDEVVCNAMAENIAKLCIAEFNADKTAFVAAADELISAIGEYADSDVDLSRMMDAVTELERLVHPEALEDDVK
jgi:hypothetical protein